MECLPIQTKLFVSLILFLSISSHLLSPLARATAPPETIVRTTKQQILASIPPNSEENSQLFLTSPSGKYAGYLLRHETTPGAGGFGNDFCYVEVQDASTGESMWESECTPVSTANTCSLVFSDKGLEVFDGSNSAWDTSADSEDPVSTLELVDDGDMRIEDNQGELVWKATDEPRSNQHCGSPGSPGLAPATSPFASPIGAGSNLPFGQPAQGNPQQFTVAFGQQQEHPSNGANQGLVSGFNSQPLLDNIPFDSGCLKGAGTWLGVTLTLVALSVSGICL